MRRETTVMPIMGWALFSYEFVGALAFARSKRKPSRVGGERGRENRGGAYLLSVDGDPKSYPKRRECC